MLRRLLAPTMPPLPRLATQRPDCAGPNATVVRLDPPAVPESAAQQESAEDPPQAHPPVDNAYLRLSAYTSRRLSRDRAARGHLEFADYVAHHESLDA